MPAQGGGRYPPLSPPSARPFNRSFLSFQRAPFLSGNTRLTASPSVFPKTRAVRNLIRTARTDTTIALQHKKSASRPPLVSSLKRRPSPDLPNAALARSNPWNTYLDRTWPVLSDQVPLQRAVTCARRSIRREVLLALGRGNGAASRLVPKSKVRCT